MTLHRLIRVLIARWRLFALMFTLVVATAVIVTILMKPRYMAQASVVLDVKSPDPIAGLLLPGMTMSSYMSTQIQVVESERVALRAAALSRLGEQPEVLERWEAAKANGAERDVWLAAFLREYLDVAPAKDSNVINIRFSALHPELAATVANAVVEAYIETTLDLRVEPARKFNAFFEERARHLRETLRTAQANLSEFQRASGIISTDERFDSETARLNELTAQWVELQAVASESNRRRNAATSNADRTPEALSNPIVVALTSELADQEGGLDEMSQQLGQAHPSVRQAQARIAQLKARIAREQRRVAQSAGVRSDIDEARLADLLEALDRQRKVLLDLREHRDRLGILQQDVENAQRAYDAAYSQYNRSEMESQVTQTNVSVLKSAKAPRQPMSPRPLLNLAAGIVFGILLGAVVVVVREFFDTRLRTADDVGLGLGYPVVGDIPKRDGSARRRTGRGGWAMRRGATAWESS